MLGEVTTDRAKIIVAQEELLEMDDGRRALSVNAAKGLDTVNELLTLFGIHRLSCLSRSDHESSWR